MDLKKLFNDDDAVSPVIGVILMVAITVILAAVIATFVLGLGDQTQTPPTASFGMDFDSDGNSTGGVVAISHGGGDSIATDELYVRGDTSSGDTISGSDGQWSNLDDYSASGSSGSSSAVVAGDSADVDVGGDDWNLRVVYVASEGDTSWTLSEDSGPDA
jgi:flagellin-like protein